MKTRKQWITWSGVAAAVVAAALLVCSGFAAVPLLRGAQTVENGSDLKSGAYVTVDLERIMDICARERRSSDDAVIGYYAIAPLGDQYILVRFPARDNSDLLVMESETGYFMNGLAGMQHHLVVTGTAHQASEEEKLLLDNWAVSMGVDSAYVGEVSVDSGRMAMLWGSLVSTGAMVAMSIGALLLLLYAVAALVLSGVSAPAKGKKKSAREKVEKVEKKEKAPAAEPVAEPSEADWDEDWTASNPKETPENGDEPDGDA